MLLICLWLRYNGTGHLGPYTDATTVASLAISQNSARVTQMLTMPGPEVRVMATKAVAIKALVVAIVRFKGRPPTTLHLKE